jgi:hypothetical protein
MTTVTGLTADRMLAIEGASVVDGDVDGSGNLILTKHDGSQINAGKVTGPPGPQGPIGSMLSVLSAAGILDMGLLNQIRAGRQLSPADFANIGLNAPLGLWNLSDLSDASGNGRALSNKGAVPFAPGINGVANTAAQFSGAVAQALYISDSGAADPFRIRWGSVGAWVRTAKRGVYQMIVDKYGTANQQVFSLYIHSSNFIVWSPCPDGVNNAYAVSGASDVADDRWHFVVGTVDASVSKIYVDGVLEATGSIPSPLFSGTSALNIGARGTDAATAGTFQHFGRVDEVFITPDVLSDDQVRNLYCAKIAHTLAAVPVRVSLNIRRRKKGGALAVADFSTQPLRLYNFSAVSFGDQGSNNQTLVPNPGGGAINGASGVDGTNNNAVNFYGTHNGLSATDTGLPAGVASRSYGCWFKSVVIPSGAAGTIIRWGTVSTADARLYIQASTGLLTCPSGADSFNGPFVADGIWHFVIVIEDNAALDGVKRKLYLDGRLVGLSTVLNAITLTGANSFRLGSDPAANPFTGQIDGAFVCDYALTADQIHALYAKGVQALSPSPKNVGDHVEGMDAANLYATFDSLDSQNQIDLAVA